MKLFSSSEEPNGLIREDVLLSTNPSWDGYFSEAPFHRGGSRGSWRRDYCQGRNPGYGEIIQNKKIITHRHLRLPLEQNRFLEYQVLLEPIQLEDELSVLIRITPLSDQDQIIARQEEAQSIAHFGYWDWYIPTGQVVWSDEVYNIFGVKKGEFIPSIDRILLFSREEERGIAPQLIQRSIDERRPGWYEMRIFRPDGEERWYESNFEPLFDGEGTLEYIKGTAHDITRIKRAEQETRERERRLKTILDSIGDGVIVTDGEGKICLMNPAAEQLTGRRVSDFKDCPDMGGIFRYHDGEAENPLKKVLRTGEFQTLPENTLLLTAGGRACPVADSMAPVRDTQGHITGAVIVFRDITEELRLQESLIQSQKMEAIGRLAAGIAHDFNNMLGGILGSCDLLRHSIAGDETVGEHLDIIVNAAEQAAELTSSLLSFSRKEPLARKPLFLHICIGKVVAILSKTIGSNIKIETMLEAGADRIKGDEARLQSALMNLGINASQAMAKGGVLTIRTGREGESILLEVRDSGTGIAPENLPRIFDPFFTTKDRGEGTGLGLAAVFNTVRDHRGTIGVSSEQGKGTSFQIRLPLMELPDT